MRPEPDASPRIPVLSLFSGAGGLDLGFEEAGFEPKLAADNDPAAVKTYNSNRPGKGPVAKVLDLSSVDPCDLLRLWEEIAPGLRPIGIIGGPPCQAFSVSNVFKFDEDPRAKLPLSYARILKTFNDTFGLEFFLFENVAGLRQEKHRGSLDAFEKAFASAGFDVITFMLDAVNFEVPQYRSRMFMAGFAANKHSGCAWSIPEGKHTEKTVQSSISHLVEPVPYRRGMTPEHCGLHPNHWYLNPRSAKFTNGSLKPGEMWGRSFRMLEWEKPSWTVAYGHREVHVHPSGKRRLTPFEALLLQGFPPTYVLKGTLSDQIRLISDAVPPPLASALALSIRTFIKRESEQLSFK